MHVQCTCKCFAPIVLLPPLQSKRRAPPMPNLQVIRIQTRPVCLAGCGVQAGRARIGKKFIREGSFGFLFFLRKICIIIYNNTNCYPILLLKITSIGVVWKESTPEGIRHPQYSESSGAFVCNG